MAKNRVILLPSPDVPTSESWPALERKRKTLWNHRGRNLLVAHVAKMCLGQDRESLKGMGVPTRRMKKGACSNRVVILVEGTEHARALAGLLPAWDVLDTLPSHEAVEEEEEQGSLLASGTIMTWMYAERNEFRANYLVRATGWRGRMGLDSHDQPFQGDKSLL